MAILNKQIQNKINRINKILNKLKEVDYKTYANNEEDIIYRTTSIKEISKEQLERYIFHERLAFAINDLSAQLAFANFALQYSTTTNDVNIEYQKVFDLLTKLTDEIISNPIGFYYISSLYNLYQSIDERIKQDIFVNAGIKYLSTLIDNVNSTDELYTYYHVFLNYFNLKKEKYTDQYLMDTFFKSYFIRYKYFDSNKYGHTFNSFIKAIKDFKISDYYNYLDEKYYQVMKRELKST